ncbi:hypothetical protein SEPL_453 [Salmonella phage SE_PL]|nr:hypothetical protein 7t3_0101 [Salmonella phage 7t3]QIG63066.1 hypothetical protein SEPL_453 [Salmonella phage SE_PL]WNV47598.1 hypothetical protein [Klebsiella phage fENko-Kae01]
MKLALQNILLLIITVSIAFGFYYVYNNAMQKRLEKPYHCYLIVKPKNDYGITERFNTTRKELSTLSVGQVYHGYTVSSINSTMSKSVYTIRYNPDNNSELIEGSVSCFED